MLSPVDFNAMQWNFYQNLPPQQRLFADIAILIFEPVSSSDYENLYSTFAGKTLKTKFKQVYVEFRLYGFFSENPYDTMRVPEFILVNALPKLLENDKYLAFAKLVYEKFAFNSHSYSYQTISPLRYIRNCIYGHFIGNSKITQAAIKKLTELIPIPQSIFAYMIARGQYLDLFSKMPPEILSHIAYFSFAKTIYPMVNPKPLELFTDMVCNLPVISIPSKDRLYNIVSTIRLYQGNISQVDGLQHLSSFSDWSKTICLMYTGKMEEAKNIFLNQVVEYRIQTKDKKFFPDIHHSFFYFLLLILYKPGSHQKELDQYTKLFEKTAFFNHQFSLSMINIASDKKYEAKKILERINPLRIKSNENLENVMFLFAVFLLEGKLNDSQTSKARELLNLAKTNGYLLITLELEWILNKDDKKFKQSVMPGIASLLSRIERKEEWEQSITNLLGIGMAKSTGSAKLEEINRLAYFVDFDHSTIQPMLQTMNKSGWSKGRNIALKRLNDRQIEGMTEQDNRIASAIKQTNSYYGHDYSFDFPKVLPELAGHPHLFLFINPDIRVELVKSQPELITEKTKSGFELSCDIDETEQKVILKKETNTRYKLIQLTDEQQSVIRALNAKKLIVPAKGKDKLAEVIAHISSFMTIHSDLAASTDENIRTVDTDSRIRVQLLPMGNALKVEWFVKPFGQIPPYCKPGKGGKTVYGILDNERSQVTRNLANEADCMQKLANAFSEVADSDFNDGPVIFNDPYECLSLLEILRSNHEIAVAEWPEGERFRVKRTASFKQLQLRVASRGSWFEMSGELNVDEDTVLSLQQLLAMRSKSKGRFIEIGEGEFVALSEELKKRLDELAMYSSVDKKELKINKFAAHILEEIGSNAGSFRTDKAWTEFRKKIKKTLDLVIDIPITLQAELRPYQEEGFRWLARLAAWDAGACLADDMGLGKTLQALALLLHRAPQGPAIVVCPASVVNNWASEAQRFAPSLNIRFLRQGKRNEALENHAPFDVLIITYGILQSEMERLGNIQWETVVLDEAQAIKNTNTKTSKSAMNLQAGFRLIMTGTPIQNHLGELWNLFNFINPGLLGSIQQFNERFVIPDQADGSSSGKQYLKKLIAPFMLRRTKSKVLEELPPKTEITHLVELSTLEMSFYEALRREAIVALETDDGPSGQKHLKALAQITRLRLACCNPLLVDKTLKLPSAKLDAFFEIVDDLLENKHRALVFSQFIGHLTIVREALDKRNISYQYLDGSTPVQDRSTIVKDFQSGTGELFLISLKAGGLGLNLTAADYVIHLDPWWNPAIEDQASDRAHRIGQTRPVTIYRLVSKNTIEEKIIQLHHTKRDMADSLLEGTDQAAKLSTIDLLNLLKGL